MAMAVVNLGAVATTAKHLIFKAYRITLIRYTFLHFANLTEIN